MVRVTADILRQAATLMRERAEAATEVWGVPVWRASLSELGDAEGYRRLPAYMQPHVATSDVHGSVVLASPWTDQAPTVHAASWHPAVALAVADWLDQCALCSMVHDSPGETDRICETCWETDAPVETEAEIDAAYKAWLAKGFAS